MGSDVQPAPLRELAGEPLEKILARGGPLPLASVADVIDRVGAALADAQAAGQVPPALQALMTAARGVAVTDAVDPLDAPAAQVWLAALAYDLLAGHPVPPSVAGHSVPKPIRTYRPEVPAEAEAAVFRALDGDPAQRFPSLAEFASALRRSTAARLEQDEEERTTVSAVPSGIAAQIRQSGALLPDDERTVVSPSGGDDELTRVSLSSRHDPASAPRLSEDRRRPLTVSSATQFTPTQQMPRVRDRVPPPPTRRLWLGAGAAAAGVVLAAVVIWRLSAGRGQPATPPKPLPVARAAAPAPSAPVRPPVAVPPPPPVAPAAPPPTPAPPVAAQATAPADPPPAAPPLRNRPTHAHGRARTPAPVASAAPLAAPDGPKSCRLSVASYPWAELWVDGADTGLQTPVVGFAISCGRHRLEFKRRDLNVDQIESVTLSDGIEFKRQYELKGAELDD